MADSSLQRVTETKRHSFLVNFFIRLVKEKPLGTIGLVITLFLLFIGIFADFVAPYDMNESHGIENYLAAPSALFWFGTDNVGRDILTRVIYGARISVIVGLGVSAVATVISLIIGIASGYIGGKVDLLVQRVVDTRMCMPSLILMMVVFSAIGRGIVPLIFIIGLMWGWIGSRIIRSAVLATKENVYVQAAVAIGCSTPRIFIRHILPNIMAPTIILFSIRVPSAILLEASLSFLGFGIPPPTPSWGGMLSGSGRTYMYQAPWMAIWPGVALSTVVYGIHMFGDAIRDILDPRLRGGVGRYKMKAKRSPRKK